MKTLNNYNAMFISRWNSGAEFISPCVVDEGSHRICEIFNAGHPCDDDSCFEEAIAVNEEISPANEPRFMEYPVVDVDELDLCMTLEDAIAELKELAARRGYWRSNKHIRLSDAVCDLQLDYIKQKLLSEGQDFVEAFLGYKIGFEPSKEKVAGLIDEVAQQMPEDEVDAMYHALVGGETPSKCLEQTIREMKAHGVDTQCLVGPYKDADTILADIMEEAEPVTGMADELFDIYLGSKDKKSIVKMFEAMTGVKFSEFINRIQDETKTWLVPVSWTMAGHMRVQACTAQEALKKGQDMAPYAALPTDGVYLEDSFQLDEDQAVTQVSGKEG